MAGGTSLLNCHKSATSNYTYPSISESTPVVHGARTIESYCRGSGGNRLSLLGITDVLNDLVLQKYA